MKLDAENRPQPASGRFPYSHRSIAEVDAAGPRQWCGICQQNVTFETASSCRSVLCPKARG